MPTFAGPESISYFTLNFEFDGVQEFVTNVIQSNPMLAMQMAEQLPVIEDGNHIVGIVDESDILLAVYQHEERFAEPVSEHMTSKLEIVGPADPIDVLLPIFRADRVAIVADGDKFHGLITQVDLLNHLRQKVT